jgi:hypothetical protein
VTKTPQDFILYALSIGFGSDPLNKEHLRFTYENDENFGAFPTIPVVIGHKFKRRGEMFKVSPIDKINPMMVLHGEVNIEMLKPIPTDTELRVTEKIIDV